MSNFPTAPISVRPPHPTEVDPALRLILSTATGWADQYTIEEFLRFLSHKGIDPQKTIRIATRADHLTWAALPMTSPGRTVLLVGPTLTPTDQESARHLTTLITSESRTQGIHLAQVLIDPAQPALLTLYESCGFWRLAELLYLQRGLRTAPTLPSPPQDIELVAYSAARHADFATTILSSYERSLDCPKLSGLRHIEDILAGHKGTGEFDPRAWFLARDSRAGRNLAVLLLARAPRTETIELVYLGIAPSARGRGLGRFLMRHAVATAAQMGGARLCLAVDAENAPALNLYYASGMARVGARVAMLKDLRVT